MQQEIHEDVQVQPFEATRLPGRFGVEIHGLDLARQMDDGVLKRLADLLYENKIVILKNQVLTDEAYVRFGYFWGKPIDFFKADHKAQEFPELIRLSNATTVPVEHRDGAVQWHSDSSYDEVPANVTMLYCKEAPLAGGVTLFSDTAAAFDALPEALQERLIGYLAWHTMLGAPIIEGECTAGLKAPEWGKYLHLLAMPHPVTGRLGLFTSATAQSIDGLPYEEGRDLIRQLRQHMVRSEFRQEYKLRANDLILWDNYAVVHSATPIEYSDEPGKRRLLYRISTKGLPTFWPAPISTI
jgi:taurine dioxygenase